MNPFWKQVIIHTVFRKDQQPRGTEKTYSSFQLAKGFRKLRMLITRMLKDIILMLTGILSAAFGLESFLLPTKFIDGGATGISLLITEITSMPLYFLRIGLSVRGGAVIDGTEVLAIFLSRKLSSTIGDIIIIINVIIFSFAAYLLSIETALYSMITYLAASKTLDFIIEGIEEYTGVTIISPHHDEIRQMIINEMGRGITVYRGRRGYGKSGEKNDVDILYTVITRLELSKLKTEIEKIDTNAFVVMSSVKDTKGGMIKKRPLKR